MRCSGGAHRHRDRRNGRRGELHRRDPVVQRSRDRRRDIRRRSGSRP